MTFFTGAVTRFRLFSPHGYNPPKIRFLYYVRFVTNNLDNQTSRDLGFFVKKIDRLQMTYEVTEMNQYNKKRLVQGKLQYGPLNFTLHDTVNGTAAKLVEAYNRFYYGDFSYKDDTSWSDDIVGNNFEMIPNWGLNGALSPNSNHFINRIEVYEIYDQVYSQINFINPMFTSVAMGGLDSESNVPQEIDVQCKYEGVVFKAISNPVTQELANMWGLPFHNDILSGLLGGLNIPGLDISSGVGLPGQSLLSSVANIVNNQINDGRPSQSFNIVNSILNGVLPQVVSTNTTFQTINGYFGSTIGGGQPIMQFLNPISSLSNILPSVASQTNVGQAVRNISTGSFNVFGPLSSLLPF